jgi:glutaredoxin
VKRDVVLLFIASVALGAASCHRSTPDGGGDNGAAPKSSHLPPLKLTDNSKNLLLTWIDKKGDFHVVQKVSDVPSEGRKAVRVVVTDNPDGTGGLVYVANLTKKRPDGTYPVTSMTRAQWNDEGATRRKQRMEEFAPSAAPPPSSAAPLPSAAPGASAHSGLIAIIYGAEWCNPCHEAARYLRERGVKVIHKDIENNEVARKEMEDKLAAAHIHTTSIPVIDIEGRLLVGFSPTAIDRALAAAQGSQTL